VCAYCKRNVSMSLREVRFTMSHEAAPTKKKKNMRKPRFPAQPANVGKRSATKNSTSIIQQDDEHLFSDNDDKMYRDANGPYTDARQTRILLFVVILWLVGISVYLVVASIQQQQNNTPVVAPPLLETKKLPTKWHIPFNLVPDNNGRIMILKVPTMNFERVLRYDVCCHKGPYYVCRAVSKNVGVECYLTKDREAVVYISHPEMVGATCTLMWTETNHV